MAPLLSPQRQVVKSTAPAGLTSRRPSPGVDGPSVGLLGAAGERHCSLGAAHPSAAMRDEAAPNRPRAGPRTRQMVRRYRGSRLPAASACRAGRQDDELVTRVEALLARAAKAALGPLVLALRPANEASRRPRPALPSRAAVPALRHGAGRSWAESGARVESGSAGFLPCAPLGPGSRRWRRHRCLRCPGQWLPRPARGPHPATLGRPAAAWQAERRAGGCGQMSMPFAVRNGARQHQAAQRSAPRSDDAEPRDFFGDRSRTHRQQTVYGTIGYFRCEATRSPFHLGGQGKPSRSRGRAPLLPGPLQAILRSSPRLPTCNGHSCRPGPHVT